MRTSGEPAEDFAAELRRHRLAAGLSQERLAELAGLSARAIREMERRRVVRPRPESVRLIGAALGLRGADLDGFRRLADEDYWADRRRDGDDQLADRPRAVAQLPAAVAAFTGRQDELDRLDGQLTGPADPREPVAAARIALVTGAAGVGKTALAVRWAHGAAGRFPGGQLYVDLRGYDCDQPVAPADALAGFLRALGVEGAAVPYELAERAAAYRTLLAERRMLVVLDNAASVDQVRPLLPGGPCCPVLVTSRDSLPGLVARHGAHRLRLEPLPRDDAVELLRALLADRVEADPAAAGVLADRCGRLPLALRVAAERALGQDDRTLAGVVAELADERDRTGLLTAGDDPRTSVEAVFSWSYRHLPAGAARTFRLLAAHPGPDADRHEVAALTGTDLTTTGRALAVLEQAHLVQSPRAGAWSQHDLLRAYAAGRPETDDAERAEAVGRLLDHHLAVAAAAMDVVEPAERQRRPAVAPAGTPAPPLPDRAAALGWLESRRAALGTAAVAAREIRPEHVTRLSAVLGRYLMSAGHQTDGFALHSLAVAAAAERGDVPAEATATAWLGTVQVQWGLLDEGAGTIRRAIELARRAGDTPTEARCLTNLAVTVRLLGHPDEATECFGRAIRLHRERGDVTGEARAMENLATLHGDCGRFPAAIQHFEQALALFARAGNETGQAEASNELGIVLRSVGRLAEAERAHGRALELFRPTGNVAGEAWALVGLGDARLAAGDLEEAARLHKQALALFERCGLADAQAWAREGLAIGLRLLGSLDEAVREHERALELAGPIGWRHMTARCRNGLGDTLRAAGRLAAAEARYGEALAEAAEIGNRYEQLRAWRGLAAAAAAAGDPARAADPGTRAAELAGELGIRTTGDLL